MPAPALSSVVLKCLRKHMRKQLVAKQKVHPRLVTLLGHEILERFNNPFEQEYDMFAFAMCYFNMARLPIPPKVPLR